jgi:hypothetical protein
MQHTKQTKDFVNLSLISTALTVLLASISHAYYFGHKAFVAGIGFLLIISALNFIYRRYANKLVLLFYFLLNIFVVMGFGIINGFWNHTIKVALTYLHGGHLPPFFIGLFQDPNMGTFFQESVGVLTFITSMFSVYYAFKIVPKNKKSFSETL